MSKTFVLIDNPTTANSVFSNIQANSLVELRCDVTVLNFTIPSGCVIRFSGGILHANILTGAYTVVEAPLLQIMDVNKIAGTWLIETVYPEWFGASPTMEGTSGQNCSPAICRALETNPSEICFSKGIYNIEESIVTTGSNIRICGKAIIRATSSMVVMIYGNYVEETTEVFSLKCLPMIHGGGCIDGNGLADKGIEQVRGLRFQVKDLLIKNTLNYGFVASTYSNVSGNSIIQNCVFQNENQYYNAVAIYNNRSDCVYHNIEIINYRIAVNNVAPNGNYINVHAWLFGQAKDSFWNDSVAFNCEIDDITMYACEADTMKTLLRHNINEFKGSLTNCRHYGEKDNLESASSIAHGNASTSKLCIIGGHYHYNNNLNENNLLSNITSINNRLLLCNKQSIIG